MLAPSQHHSLRSNFEIKGHSSGSIAQEQSSRWRVRICFVPGQWSGDILPPCSALPAAVPWSEGTSQHHSALRGNALQARPRNLQPKQPCFSQLDVNQSARGNCKGPIVPGCYSACDFLLCIFGWKLFILGQYPTDWFICKIAYKWLNIR